MNQRKINQVARHLLTLCTFIFLQASVIFAQNKTISVQGVVVDNGSEPLIGVAVMLQNSKTGTMTDIDGKFFLENVPADAIIEVTCIGFKPYLKPVAPKMRIVLEEDKELLDEVVVVGFGTQKKVNITGSVTSVGGEVFESRPISNVSQALQGVMPGLNVTTAGNAGGELNAAPIMNVRGAGTIGAGSSSSPLVLIDGFPGDLNTLNSDDIESVTVLKDAASSSIYGSRAPFGVILVTTKSAKAGKISVSYNDNFRLNSPMNLPESMAPLDFATMYSEGRANGGYAPNLSQQYIDNIIAKENGEIGLYAGFSEKTGRWFSTSNAAVDWYKVHYKSWVLSQDHSLSIKGGTDKFSFYLSGNVMDQEGLLRFGDDGLMRYNLTAKINSNVSKFFKIAYSTNWVRTDYEAPSYAVRNGGLMYHEILRNWPIYSVVDNNGYYTEFSMIPQLQQGGRYRESGQALTQMLKMVFTPVKNWNINLEGTMRNSTDYHHNEILPVYCHDIEGQPYIVKYTSGSSTPGYTEITEDNWHTDYYSTNLFSDYSIDFKGNYFKVLFGFNAELEKARSLHGNRTSLITPSVPTLDTATENDKVSGGYDHWTTAGFFGRLNYNYKERYLLEGNVRYDGTSRFRTDKRWNVFSSFSAGWNIAKEPWMKSAQKYVNNLKFRVSFGELGNQNTYSYYPFYETMNLGIKSGTWLVNGNKTNVSNAPDMISALLTWEKVQTTNIALDWGFFNNRLTGQFDYFIRKTLDMVGPAPELPHVLGAYVPMINNADMMSKGFEFELSWRDNIKDFNYGIKFNLSDSRQQILRYSNESGTLTTWREGQYMGEIWGYETIGIAKSQADMTEHLLSLPNGGQNRLGTDWRAGDIMYRDVNGDGEISSGANTIDDHGDLVIIGNTTPRFNYGITLDAEYKGFDVMIFLQGVGKRDFMPPYADSGAIFWGTVDNQYQGTSLKPHFDYFRPEGHPAGANLDAYYPRPIVGTSKNQQAQTRYLQDASYMRLKNVQFGYTLPSKLMSKIHVSRLRFYLSLENMATVTKLSPVYDPEVLDGSWGTGKAYPLSKVVSFGMNLNF